jgi:hypothetical protein
MRNPSQEHWKRFASGQPFPSGAKSFSVEDVGDAVAVFAHAIQHSLHICQ